MAWYRLTVSSPYLRTEQTRDIEVPNECSESEKENFIQSKLETFVWEYVSADWEEIDESEKEE